MKFLNTLILGFAAVTLAACGGYTAINQNFDDYSVREIYVKDVEVNMTERRIGARLNAQYLKQLLSRRFTGDENSPLHLSTRVRESHRKVSFRIDATAERALVTIDSTSFVKNKEGDILANIETRTDAAYEIQTSPFATQANYDQARETAIQDLQRDLQRQLNLFLKDYTDQKNTAESK